MRTYTSPEEIDAQMKAEKERKQVSGLRMVMVVNSPAYNSHHATF